MTDASSNMAAPPTHACGLEEILKTEELATHSARPKDYQGESAALVALAQHMAASPGTILQKLTDTALALCGAGSAGLSLEETSEGKDIFRWRAVSGRLRPFLNGTMPRHFSPCGVTVDQRKPLLMRDMVRHYEYVAGLGMPIREVLLVPFFRGERAVGTLWVVAHDETGFFDAEHARVIGSLAQFAAAAVETVATLARVDQTRFQLDEVRVKLEAALEAGSIATWAWNIPQNRVHADAYCASLFSMPEESAEGEPVERFLAAMHPDDRQRVQAKIDDVVKHGELYEVEYRLRNNTGIDTWVIARGKVLRDASGEAVHMAGVVVDITDRKEEQLARETEKEGQWARERASHAALREARDQAVAASRAKDDFLAALSHELRTPLNPVLLLASDMAGNADYSKEVRADFETVYKGVELEARLIDDLLDLTRITSGKLKLDCGVVDLHAIAREAEEKVAADAHDKHITIQWDLAATRSSVHGDAVRLQQVFWNVLKNAVKFTPVRGVIRIESRDSSDEQEIQVQVQDSGIGIDPRELGGIFGAFTQGTNVETGAHLFGGLGLGLAISQKIMQMHAGRIIATSQGSGQGSSFSIEMPARATAAAGAVNPQESAPAPAAMAGLSILLVEDHPPTRQILERLLTRRGHGITAVGSGREACDHVKTRDFDLLICDVGLPDTDGHTLLQDLCRLRPGLRAIAMTGYGTEHDVEKSDRAGFLTHLTKPVSISRLEDALRSIQPRQMAA